MWRLYKLLVGLITCNPISKVGGYLATFGTISGVVYIVMTILYGAENAYAGIIFLSVVPTTFFGGLILGLVCVSHIRFIRYPTLAVVNAVRGIPLLMVIFWMYFLLPALIGQPVAEGWTIIAALSLFTSAYMSQIVQAGWGPAGGSAARA